MRFEPEEIGGVLVVHIRMGNDEELSRLGALKGEVSRHVEAGHLNIVVDLKELDFIDSKGMGALVGCARLIEEKAGKFVVYGMGLRLTETLHIVRLNQVVPFRMTQAQAVVAAESELGEDGFAELIRGNPGLPEVRAWWDENGDSLAPAGPSHVPFSDMTRRQPEPKETKFLSDWASPDLVRLRSLIEGNHHLQDWMQALYLFSEAKRLSQRYEIEFNAEMSFKEFLSNLADSLSTVEDGQADTGAP